MYTAYLCQKSSIHTLSFILGPTFSQNLFGSLATHLFTSSIWLHTFSRHFTEIMAFHVSLSNRWKRCSLKTPAKTPHRGMDEQHNQCSGMGCLRMLDSRSTKTTWPMAKLFGITYLVVKISRFDFFFQGPLAEWDKNHWEGVSRCCVFNFLGRFKLVVACFCFPQGIICSNNHNMNIYIYIHIYPNQKYCICSRDSFLKRKPPMWV